MAPGRPAKSQPIAGPTPWDGGWSGMEHASAFTPTVLERWRKRKNLLPGLVLVALAAAGWAYTAHQASTMEMSVMAPVLFLSGWVAMMVAMMLPATLPLILLYRLFTRRRLAPARARARTGVLLAGYVGVWAVAGLPVYAYGLVAEWMGAAAVVLPGLLLMAGGLYQFTDLKGRCHARCSSPLSFLMQRWRPGSIGALRLGALHGLDCLGCCASLMVGLVALGMMNLAWMLTASVVIFAEKTLPGSHRIARPLGALMVAGGAVLVGTPLFGETGSM